MPLSQDLLKSVSSSALGVYQGVSDIFYLTEQDIDASLEKFHSEEKSTKIPNIKWVSTEDDALG